jgi:aspartyl-tRNA synthetase
MYRTHSLEKLSQIKLEQIGKTIKIAGFLDTKRIHAGVLFLVLREGCTTIQCVLDSESEEYEELRRLPIESTISLEGKIILRTSDTIKREQLFGDVEFIISSYEIHSRAQALPFSLSEAHKVDEHLRLKYRFLDLRTEKMQKALFLRTKIIDTLRHKMKSQGFLEVQTPILTASSPEGARDFLVPSRLQPGKFYALPQAPQQFKQLLMASGVQKYFQVAPCFRDEASRADRSPGEFYQLDFEMSWATQEEVFRTIEPVLHDTFLECAEEGSKVSPYPFEEITYKAALLHYGSDKPDLRQPYRYEKVDFIEHIKFTPFEEIHANGELVYLVVPEIESKPLTKKYLKSLEEDVKKIGLSGLGYIFIGDELSGPLVKFFSESYQEKLKTMYPKSYIFFLGAKKENYKKLQESKKLVLSQICEYQEVIDEKMYKFAWVIDFPMYEYDDDEKKVVFAHNPFSMPKGGLKTLDDVAPLDIVAQQYDIVVNGIELSSGAVRNHSSEGLIKAFSLAGYSQEEVETKFSGMLKAFSLGVPPHAGSAPGIDRMVMLLLKAKTIRDVIAFPLAATGEDLLMEAPNYIEDGRLVDYGLKYMPSVLEKMKKV